MIPMVDLKTQYHTIKNEIDRAVLDAIESTQFILGPNVTAFEKEAAGYLGARHAITCASGTDALQLAILAAGIKPGDEVITSPFTFIATAEAICYAGAIPVFVDIDPKTFNIDPALIEAAITPRTRAIIPVHIFGQPADMTPIAALCDKHKLLLIEDCAQSFGAAIDGRMTGTIGALGCFSFFPSKNLGAYGDGGMLMTHSDDIAQQVKVLRNHGSEVRYYHDVIGYNSRLDEMQAVILRAKLKRIDQYNQARRHVAHLYSELMADLPLITPHEDGLGEHVYHQYTLLSDRRDDILKALQDKQVGCAVYYPVPLHQQNVFKEECAGLSLPVTESVSATCFSLPICPFLEDETIREIVGIIRGVLIA